MARASARIVFRLVGVVAAAGFGTLPTKAAAAAAAAPGAAASCCRACMAGAGHAPSMYCQSASDWLAFTIGAPDSVLLEEADGASLETPRVELAVAWPSQELPRARALSSSGFGDKAFIDAAAGDAWPVDNSGSEEGACASDGGRAAAKPGSSGLGVAASRHAAGALGARAAAAVGAGSASSSLSGTSAVLHSARRRRAGRPGVDDNGMELGPPEGGCAADANSSWALFRVRIPYQCCCATARASTEWITACMRSASLLEAQASLGCGRRKDYLVAEVAQFTGSKSCNSLSTLPVSTNGMVHSLRLTTDDHCIPPRLQLATIYAPRIPGSRNRPDTERLGKPNSEICHTCHRLAPLQSKFSRFFNAIGYRDNGPSVSRVKEYIDG
jgi:hypothetical protein